MKWPVLKASKNEGSGECDALGEHGMEGAMERPGTGLGKVESTERGHRSQERRGTSCKAFFGDAAQRDENDLE